MLSEKDIRKVAEVTFEVAGYDKIILVSNVSDLVNQIATNSAELSNSPWVQVADNWDNSDWPDDDSHPTQGHRSLKL